MTKHTRAELVPLEVRQEAQSLETVEVSQTEQSELPMSELDTEIECPRCNEMMELDSKFDALVYFCESCSFLLKCV
jgi:Zn finger protein HypA/HybF involved in hydrogenase expression